MRALADIVGNRIHLKTRTRGDAEFAETLAKCRSVLGANWSKSNKAWTYPLNLETARQLRDAFGDDLVLTDALQQWGWAERKREDELNKANTLDIDRLSTIDLPAIREHCPGMWEAMMNRPYQPVAAYYMAVARQCLNGDQPGIGKTIETLGALVQLGVTGPVLVLAPRTSVKSVWEPEINKWLATYDQPWTLEIAVGTRTKVDKAYSSHRVNCAQPGMHILVCNAEQARIKRDTECPSDICNGDEDWCPQKDKHINRSTVRKPYLHSVAWSAIIADETHKWLINTRGKNASQVGYGFTRLKTVDNGPRWALSGTPLKGKKYNMFGTLNWCRPRVYTSKWRFIKSYFQTVEDGYSMNGQPTSNFISDEAKERFFRNLNGMMIRRTKSELRAINPAWMPPEKRYHDIWVSIEGTQLSHYKAMEKSAEAALDGGVLAATGILAEMTRLKQIAGTDGKMEQGHFVPTLPSAKFDWLVQFLEERGISKEPSEEVNKVVVASQFTSMINLWVACLMAMGIPTLKITGQTKDAERVQQSFQSNDEYRVLFINTNAGGVSITLDAADDIVIMDETWVPDEQEQVEDRVHRASNVEHQVDVWYVRAKGTIEEGIAAVNADKAESNHVALDAQRGLAFAAERFGTKVEEG